MTKALDLLNALSASEIAAMTAQPDPEGHIVVGGDRHITVPSNLARLGVQYDHNMETVTFDCPRYWDGRDMSQMAVYVNYMRSDDYADKYPVDNVTVDGEVMHFDWTISRNVTEVPGTVAFLVCVMKTDDEGNEERHWNSELCQDCYISRGMETEEHPALQYPDEVTQLLLRMATVETINVQAEEMAQLLADTQTAAAEAEASKIVAVDEAGYIRNAYAPAIKGNVSGEAIRVDDVSPIEHEANCWVRGKNLFDISKIEDSSYLTNNGDGTITIAASQYHVTTGKKLSEVCPHISVGDVCVLSFENESASSKFIHLSITGTWFPDSAKTITREMLNSTIAFYGVHPNDSNYGETNVISNIQIEFGTIASEYTPFIDPSTISVVCHGKNLLKASNIGGNVAYNTTNDLYTISSTGSRSIYTLPVPIPKGTQCTIRVECISGKITNPASSGQAAVIGGYHIDDAGSSWQCAASFPTGEGVSLSGQVITATAAVTETVTDIYFFFYASSVTIDTPIVCKVQFEIGDTATDHEAYTEEEILSPSSDGTCTVTSKSPTMTLFSDTPGVTIEAEYNRDTTKMFESYVLTDDAKSEIAALIEADMAEVLASLNEYATSLTGGDS